MYKVKEKAVSPSCMQPVNLNITLIFIFLYVGAMVQ